MQETKRVLILSDTHVGSEVGLCPSRIVLNNGTPREYVYKANEVQEIIDSNFKRIIKEVGAPDILVLNGDTIDGYNDKAHGLGEITTDLNEQVKMAKTCLSSIKAKKVYVTKGSNYHTGSNFNCDQAVADALHGEYRTTLKLNVANVILHFAHKLGNSKRTSTKATAIMGQLQESLVKSPYQDIDILVRSHVHYYLSINYGYKCAVVTPALKSVDNFVRETDEIVLGGTSLGAVYVDCTKGNYYIEPMLFDIPKNLITEEVIV